MAYNYHVAKRPLDKGDSMYEKTYGYKYNDGKNLSLADIAKLMRADVKEAKAHGLLAKTAKVSVRTHLYAGGGSINIVLTMPDAWIARDDSKCAIGSRCDGLGWHYDRCDAAVHLTDEAAAAKMTLERIHSAYNHDGSESQIDYFDVRYYGSVEVAGRFGAGLDHPYRAPVR